MSGTAKRISVLVVDGRPLYREMAARVVAADRRLVTKGEAADGHEALEKARELEPDAILLAASSPEPESDEVLRRLRAAATVPKVLLLADGPTPDLHDAIEESPDSLLYKSAEGKEICDEIVAMSEGDERSQGRLLLERARTYVVGRPKLKSQEVKVLEFKAAGLKDGQVAKEMHWSKKTVEAELRTIRHEMNAENTIQAVAKAYEFGILVGGRHVTR